MANQVARLEYWAQVDVLKARGRADRPLNEPPPPPDPAVGLGLSPLGNSPLGTG